MREGLLRSIPPSPPRALGSMKTAENWLREAAKNLDGGTINSSVMASYLAMFHAARSVLFLDGFREKSHYCIARYLEEKYAKSGALERRWIEILDHQRELRHNSQYDIGFETSEDEAEEALKTSKEFVERMKLLLGKLGLDVR